MMPTYIIIISVYLSCFIFLLLFRSSSSSLAHVRLSAQSTFMSDQISNIIKFTDMKIHEDILKALGALCIINPTPIQSKSFVPVSAGKDVVLCSETGSGKTLAYLVPLVNRIRYQLDLAHVTPFRQQQPPVILLSPTDDLCTQVSLGILSLIKLSKNPMFLQDLVSFPLNKKSADDCDKIDKVEEGFGLHSCLLRGDGNNRLQWSIANFVVSTPHKLLEELSDETHSRGRIVSFPSVVVFDEVDYLLGSMRREIVGILELIEKRRASTGTNIQLIFCGSTIPSTGPYSIGTLLLKRYSSAEFVYSPTYHRIPESIKVFWHYLNLPAGRSNFDDVAAMTDKCQFLAGQLMTKFKQGKERIIIFTNTVDNCRTLFKFLSEHGWPVCTYSKGKGGRSEPRRADSVSFISGHCRIMVATDFASRGLDWPAVDYIINFDMPKDAITWIHRAGRCGRMGRPGNVISLVSERDKYLASQIECCVNKSENYDGNLSKLFSSRRSLSKRKKSKDREEGKDEPMTDM